MSTARPTSRNARKHTGARRRSGVSRQLSRRGIGCLLLGGGGTLFVIGLSLALLISSYMGFAESLTYEEPERRVPTPLPTPGVVVGGGEVSSELAAEPTPAAEEPSNGEIVSNDGAIESTRLLPFNILLLGVDERPENEMESARSDTLILVHVDPVDRWISMLSIPRDSIVQVPEFGWMKINTAYTLGYSNAEEIYGRGTEPIVGGAALASETVEGFLGVKVHYTAQVDFHGFELVVDTVGGLTIDVPKPLLDAEYPTENYGFERIYIPAGLQVLDGQTALRYARSRHNSDDFDRSCRQQRVLRAMLREVRNRDVFEQLQLAPEILDDIKQSVATSLPINDLGVVYSLLELAQSLSSDRIMQFSINPSNVQIVNLQGSDIYWSENDIRLLVNRMMAGPDSETEQVATIQVQNGAGVPGLAGQVTTNLAAQEFAMVEPIDAPGYFENSLIIDYTGHPETRQRLAELLGIETDYVQAEPDGQILGAASSADIVLIVGQDYQEQWAEVDEEVATTAPPPVSIEEVEAEELPNLPPTCSADF